jgi:exonuclease VII large subunit
VLERGYSILRLDDGKVLTDQAGAPEGTAVRAELRTGAVRLRSLGSDSDGKQEGR